MLACLQTFSERVKARALIKALVQTLTLDMNPKCLKQAHQVQVNLQFGLCRSRSVVSTTARICGATTAVLVQWCGCL